MTLTSAELMFLITHYKYSKTSKINMELLKTFTKEHLQFIMRLLNNSTEKSKDFFEYKSIVHDYLQRL